MFGIACEFITSGNEQRKEEVLETAISSGDSESVMRTTHSTQAMTTRNRKDGITIRKSAERGHAEHGWLDSKHTFSFGGYHDSDHMGFRSLRVINQDRVRPGAGFPTHPHRDMEIFSYVIDGALEHRDSMGNGSILKPGQIQLMSAGSGVTHSEFNPSANDPLHFLQIWIHPREKGLEPSYTEWSPSAESESDARALVISPDGRNGSARIRQDAEVWRIRLEPGDEVSHHLVDGRGLWLQVIDGPVRLNEATLGAGDGARAETDGEYRLVAGEVPVEALLFDLR